MITGTPGVGKTTVSQKLTVNLNAKYVNISKFIKENKLKTKIDNDRETLIVDVAEVSQALEKILEKKYGTIIIDGHYAVDVIPSTEVSMVFVLRRDPRELRNVLQNRGYNTKKIWENIDAEILDVCLSDALSAIDSTRVCEIDVSGKNLDLIVEEITEILNKNRSCNYGKVDWLGKLESEGQLEDLLKNIRLAEQT